MKIFSPKIIRKAQNTKIDPTIRKILNSPKGPKLRSRKIIYDEKEILNQVDKDIQDKEQISPKKTEKKPHFQDKQQNQNPLKPTSQHSLAQNLMKTQRQNRNQESESDPFEGFSEEEQQQEKLKTLTKRKKRQARPFPLRRIINCNQFKKVKQVDFVIYFKILTKAKMFSTLLVNEFGQVIFADRLGSEHFQGSLNNFGRNPIYSMILECKLGEFFEKVQKLKQNDSTVLKLLIYSKNSKRRYSKSSNQISLTNKDLFNRYLKCISCQVTPIQITLSSTQQFEGFWNTKLFQVNKPLKCFLFKTRLSKSLPQLEKLDLNFDKKIEKFLKYTRKKQAEKDSVKLQHQASQEQEVKQKSQEFGIQKYLQNSQLNEKEIQNIYSQMNDEVKHSKSALTRGFLLNSGEGKQRCSFD